MRRREPLQFISVSRSRGGVRVVGALLVSALALGPALGSAPVAVAQPAPPDRVEQIYASSSPVEGVTASVVRRHIPLPDSAGPRPEACDWVSYLRFRSDAGPSASADADRILVAQPGVLEGAGAFESVARNTVAEAARAGQSIEFWALDRRSNCLEDHTGIDAALASGSFGTAADYYFDRVPVAGRQFGGFDTTAPHVQWLRGQGLEQTLRDQYDLMVAEIPDQRTRAEKMLCGGHSLGGFLTANFAEWDFDGDPATTADAGFNQCAGYFALDTAIDTELTSLLGVGEIPALPPEVDAVLDATTLQIDTVAPVLALPAVINPETLNLVALVGLAARLDPEGVNDIIERLPHNFNIDATLRVLLSRDAGVFATGQPDIRTINATNTAILGAILDDNSMPFGILQTSVGFIDGPVAPKQFPLPYEVTSGLPLGGTLFGDAPKLAPTEIGPGTVYRWRDYDAVEPGDQPYTTPQSEVTSIHDLARSLSEPPLDFTEWYFPTGLITDLTSPSSTVVASRLYDGAAGQAPTLTFTASGGIEAAAPANPRGRVVDLPGYNHLDVLTAAARQNDGRPEQVSTQLAAFARDLA